MRTKRGHTKLPARPPAINATPINKITLARQAAGPSDPQASPEKAEWRCDLSRRETTKKPTAGCQRMPPPCLSVGDYGIKMLRSSVYPSDRLRAVGDSARGDVVYQARQRTKGSKDWTYGSSKSQVSNRQSSCGPVSRHEVRPRAV